MTELRASPRIEARLRCKANAQGMGLSVSRRPENIDNFGGYMLVDHGLNAVIAGSRFDLSADEVAEYLA